MLFNIKVVLVYRFKNIHKIMYYKHVQLNLLHVVFRVNIGLLQFRRITPFQDGDHLFVDVTSTSKQLLVYNFRQIYKLHVKPDRKRYRLFYKSHVVVVEKPKNYFGLRYNSTINYSFTTKTTY